MPRPCAPAVGRPIRSGGNGRAAGILQSPAMTILLRGGRGLPRGATLPPRAGSVHFDLSRKRVASLGWILAQRFEIWAVALQNVQASLCGYSHCYASIRKQEEI